MKLYVCWTKGGLPWPRKERTWKPRDHSCKRAYDALKEAGYSPEVTRAYGLHSLPDFTKGRREVRRLTGDSGVPLLVLDDGTWVKHSENITAWARENPA